MTQILTTYLPFSNDELRLVTEAVDRVMAELRHPVIDRALVRRAVVLEMRRGAPVMFRLVNAGKRACDEAAAQAQAAVVPSRASAGVLDALRSYGP